MHNAAVPYALFHMTHEPIWVGAAAFAFQFPQMLTSIPGGHLADRNDRRRVLLTMHVLMAPVAGALAFLWASGAATPWAVLGLTALLSGLVGLQMPASQTLASEIVPPSLIANAVHLNVVALQGARALGPLLAGFVLANWGAGWAFGIDAASFLFALVTLLLVRTTRMAHADTSVERPDPTVRQTWKVQGIATGVILTAIIALLGPPVVQLSTLLADQTFHVDANGYGRLLGAYGVGSLSGALLLSFLAHRYRRSTTVTTAVLCFGLALMALGVGHSYVVGLVAIALAGTCFSISLGSLNSGIQTASPMSSRGKAVSLYLIALNGGAAIGALIGGWASGFLAPETVVGIAGLLLALVGVVYTLRPTLQQLDLSTVDADKPDPDSTID